MFPATACTFRSCHLVAEENAPNRIRPTCVQARPSCRPCRTKRELLFPRKIFSWLLSFSINPRIPLVASGLSISTFGFVNKHAAWCGMLAVVIAWLLPACASSSQEGVVTEPTEDHMTSTAAHFPHPSYAPGGEGGTSSGHF